MIHRYTMQEIRELYHDYKTPIFKTDGYSSITPEPGYTINIRKDENTVLFHEFDKKMSFMEFLEYYGPKMKKRKLEEKTNKLTR